MDPAELRQRLDAYYRSDSDGDGAAIIGISRMAFKMWRKRQGLPTKLATRVTLTEAEVRRRAPLAIDSASVAKAVGRSRKQIYESLRQMGLPTPGRFATSKRHAAWKRRELEGVPRSVIARRYRVSSAAVSWALGPKGLKSKLRLP